MAIGDIQDEQALAAFITQVIDRRPLAITGQVPVFTTATLPSSASFGYIVAVSDAAAGSKFQGWDGAAWVPLG